MQKQTSTTPIEMAADQIVAEIELAQHRERMLRGTRGTRGAPSAT
jgi:hypothetical protein